MFRLLCLLIFAAVSAPLHAQVCPDFFRFVDFGQLDRDGEIHRGGAVFRAESFEGEPLLREDGTDCLPVSDLAKDGPGNPVPVVSLIAYDPTKIGLDLEHLTVAKISNPAEAAVSDASAHLATLEQSDTVQHQGSHFLCARQLDASQMSCQIRSPFGGNQPLVVYCDKAICKMAFMVMNDDLIASATWRPERPNFADLEDAANDIDAKIRGIHAFLTPLSSGL
jgi:hypothetical protein